MTIRLIFTLILLVFVIQAGRLRSAPPDKISLEPIVASQILFPEKSGALQESLAFLNKSLGTNAVTAAEDLLQTSIQFPKPNSEFWPSLEALAVQTNTRVEVQSNGSVLKLLKQSVNSSARISSISGPFRVVPKQWHTRRDFETGTTHHDLQLLVHWEPRFPVNLIDATPKLTKFESDLGPILADTSTSQVQPVGYAHTAVIRIKELSRVAKEIAEIRGEFQVVAAPKWLAIPFENLPNQKPMTTKTEGIEITMQPIRAVSNRLEFRFELLYPESHPEFESFQLWAANNTLSLISPDQKIRLNPDDYNTQESGRRVRANYSFDLPKGLQGGLQKLQGWRAIYTTPAPLVKQSFSFELKGILLP